MREFWDEIILRGGECETRKKMYFSKERQNGNFAGTVQAGTQIFFRSQMMKRIASLESSREI